MVTGPWTPASINEAADILDAYTAERIAETDPFDGLDPATTHAEVHARHPSAARLNNGPRPEDD